MLYFYNKILYELFGKQILSQICLSNKNINFNGIINPNKWLKIPISSDDSLFNVRNECCHNNKHNFYNSYLLKKYEYAILLGVNPTKAKKQLFEDFQKVYSIKLYHLDDKNIKYSESDFELKDKSNENKENKNNIQKFLYFFKKNV